MKNEMSKHCRPEWRRVLGSVGGGSFVPERGELGSFRGLQTVPASGRGSLSVTDIEVSCFDDSYFFQLDKVYDPNAPEDDMMERYEEMNRMREHVMKEVDKDHDAMISYDEFMDSTKQKEFEEDEGWDVSLRPETCHRKSKLNCAIVSLRVFFSRIRIIVHSFKKQTKKQLLFHNQMSVPFAHFGRVQRKVWPLAAIYFMST